MPVPIESRGFVVAAFVDELVGSPELLRAYCTVFGDADDVTLAIHAPDLGAGVERLQAMLAGEGLDAPGSPDLLVVPGGDDALAAIADRADAVLSRTPPARFAGHPHFDATTVRELRARADAAAVQAAEAEADGPPPPGGAVRLGDDTLEVPPDMQWAFADGAWCEREATMWFDRLLASSPAPVVYDVGGNCGWFSLRAAQAGAAVWAFEPVPETADVLERNLSRHDRAVVVRTAVGERAGRASMHIYSSSGNNSLVERSLPPDHPLRHEGIIEVPVIALDDFASRGDVAAPTLLKVDVEGFELPALRGARDVLARARPAVLLEWAENTANDAGYHRDDIVAELRAHGLRPYGVRPDGTLVAPEDADEAVQTLVAGAEGADVAG